MKAVIHFCPAPSMDAEALLYKNEDGSESAECAGQFSDALAPKPREGGAPHNEQGEREKAKSEIDGKTA